MDDFVHLLLKKKNPHFWTKETKEKLFYFRSSSSCVQRISASNLSFKLCPSCRCLMDEKHLRDDETEIWSLCEAESELKEKRSSAGIHQSSSFLLIHNEGPADLHLHNRSSKPFLCDGVTPLIVCLKLHLLNEALLLLFLHAPVCCTHACCWQNLHAPGAPLTFMVDLLHALNLSLLAAFLSLFMACWYCYSLRC